VSAIAVRICRDSGQREQRSDVDLLVKRFDAHEPAPGG
jgi:hypothetical protein